jgi:hypothetical protein
MDLLFVQAPPLVWFLHAFFPPPLGFQVLGKLIPSNFQVLASYLLKATSSVPFYLAHTHIKIQTLKF